MGQRPRHADEYAGQLTPWSTACPDWEDRLLAGRPLVPDFPLFRAEADRALRIFKRLRIPDVIGTPTMAEACGHWFFPIIEVLFGAFDPAANRRMIQEFFWLVPKGNSKSSNGGAVMVTALIVNRRPEAEFVLVAPTKEIADIAFRQASGTIRLDAELSKIFHLQRHLRLITHRKSGATLKIKAADTDVITGGKQLGTMVDETHVFAEHAGAADVFLELRGSLGKRPDGFLFQATTQSKRPPAGVFAAELAKARAVRDGKLVLPLLPILYELPERLSKDGGWKEKRYWPLVNPNLGRSQQADFLERELLTAEEAGDPAKLALFASQHFNVQIGTALAADNWPGAQYWEANADPALSLDSLLARCDTVVVGLDGGGLDDLLGLAVVGRERHDGAASEANESDDGTATTAKLARRRWLHWGHAWAHQGVLERRKEIAPRLLDFKADGDLTIVPGMQPAFDEAAAIVHRVAASGLTPEKAWIGADQAGLGLILEAIGARGIDTSPEAGIVIGIPQGWKLMSAIKTVEVKLAEGTFVHCGTRLMAWCVGNAKVVPVGNAISITKQAAGKAKIDPLMALLDGAAIMAMNPQSGAGRGIFEFYRAAAAATRPQPADQPAMVRLRAPPGISAVYGISGRQYLVGSGRIVDVTAEDATPLAGQGFESA